MTGVQTCALPICFPVTIASISLVVGGIGIMNSMLISVSQRIREIGLRKAVGARARHIITQFLIESAFITLLGGIVGILFGVAVAFLAAVIIPKLGYEWEFLVPISSIAIAFTVSIGIGFLFGLYPAIKAYRDWETDRKSTRLNSSHRSLSRMPSSA